VVKLDTEELRQLVSLLQNLPELANEQSRRQILELAGLRQLLAMIDISGSPFLATSKIVSYLADYGRLTYENETLGLFLNLIKSFVGVQQQEYLDRLLLKHDMMTPIAPSPAISQWQDRETATDVLEKIIGENTLRPIAFLTQGLLAARSVAYIGVVTSNERWSGTGFLIAPDLVLTNHHVLPNADLLPTTLIRLNYEENFKGEALRVAEYRAKRGGIFHTRERLDYAFFQVENTPGKEWGWLPLAPRVVRKNDRVNIIQHPNGQPKQISLQNNFVQYVGENVVQYVTSTLPGSSGSPVFNDAWEVVALHHAGGTVREPTTQNRYFRNEGILIESILADLPENMRQEIVTTAPG
jgi:V8-like Glu-specific endopeptidase